MANVWLQDPNDSNTFYNVSRCTVIAKGDTENQHAILLGENVAIWYEYEDLRDLMFTKIINAIKNDCVIL